MKKRILSLVLALTLFLSLSGCSCKHEWLDATCTTPATCAKCGEAAGSPLGHSWKDATCTQPQTCSVCGATNGQPLGHQWLPATCTASETCSVCGETQGDAPLGHTLNEKGTCTVCGEAVGTPLTMGNYIQYLTFSLLSQESGASYRGSKDYRPTVKVAISVTPNSNYTYHNVNVSWGLTTTNTSRWLDRGSSSRLIESGLFNGDNSIMYSTYEAETATKYWTCTTESEAKQFSPPKYSFKITGITGYVIPVETDTQNN